MVLALVAGCADGTSSTDFTGSGASAGTGGSGVGGDAAGGSAGGGGEAVEPTSGDIYVDATSGDDGSSGAVDDPLKTIGQALVYWTEGRDIVLNAGTFSSASGETWGYAFPEGLTLHTNTDGVILRGTPEDVAFTFDGNGTIQHVTFEDFGTAVRASVGTQTLTGVGFEGTDLAIELLGDAVMTLDEYPEFVGGAVAEVRGTASLTLESGIMRELSTKLGAGAISVSDDAELSLAQIQAELSTAPWVVATDSALVGIADSQVADTTTATAVLGISGTSVVTLSGVDISGVAGGGSALSIDGEASVFIEDGLLDGADDAGLVLHAGTASIAGTTFSANAHALRFEGGGVTVEQCWLVNNDRGLTMGATGSAMIRRTTFTDNYEAVHALGGFPNLGNGGNRGENVITSADEHANITFADGLAGVLPAIGNTWEPNTDFADAAGQYSVPQFVGPYPGENFDLPEGVTILLD